MRAGEWTDVECLVLSHNEFLGLFNDAPAMRRRVVRSLATTARAADRSSVADEFRP